MVNRFQERLTWTLLFTSLYATPQCEFEKGAHIEFSFMTSKLKIECMNVSIEDYQQYLSLNSLNDVYGGYCVLSIKDSNFISLPSNITKISSKCSLFELVLTNNNIEMIEENTINNTFLRILNLENNKLTKINFLVGISDLTELNLNGNNLKEIHANDFESVQQLQYLYLAFNQLESIYRGFSNLPQLKVLILNNNNLVNISTNTFKGLQNLTTLDLSRNQISVLNRESFSGLTNLQELLLNNNKIEVIPLGTFQKNKQLKYLSPAFDQSEGFSNLPQLKVLILNNNNLVNISANTFRGLQNLTTLDLSSNQISVLNCESFSGLTNLQELLLNDNAITEIPLGTFQKNKQLKYLSPALDQSESIHQGSSKLPQLKVLILNNNNLVNISANTFRGLQNLTTLDLSSNEISVLNPESFSGLTNLQELLLNNNMIKEIPLGTFQNFPGLNDLQLAQNHLRHFKIGTFSNLKQLSNLNISHNALAALKEIVFYPLEGLNILDLDDNRLYSIEYTSLLLYLRNVYFISVNGNNWDCEFLTHMLNTFKNKSVHYLYNTTSVYIYENVDGILCRDN